MPPYDGLCLSGMAGCGPNSSQVAPGNPVQVSMQCYGCTLVHHWPADTLGPGGEFRLSPDGPVSQIHSPHFNIGAPGIFADLLRCVQMLKIKWGAKRNGKLPHLFILSKTATSVPEFAVKDLPLDRTATFVPEFAVKDILLGRKHWWSWWCNDAHLRAKWHQSSTVYTRIFRTYFFRNSAKRNWGARII